MSEPDNLHGGEKNLVQQKSIDCLKICKINYLYDIPQSSALNEFETLKINEKAANKCNK